MLRNLDGAFADGRQAGAFFAITKSRLTVMNIKRK
jgi:hypothetical protein